MRQYLFKGVDHSTSPEALLAVFDSKPAWRASREEMCCREAEWLLRSFEGMSFSKSLLEIALVHFLWIFVAVQVEIERLLQREVLLAFHEILREVVLEDWLLSVCKLNLNKKLIKLISEKFDSAKKS